MDLVTNYLVKFVLRSDAKSYVSRQQLWLTNLVRTIGKKSGFSSSCVIGDLTSLVQLNIDRMWKTLISRNAI